MREPGTQWACNQPQLYYEGVKSYLGHGSEGSLMQKKKKNHFENPLGRYHEELNPYGGE